MYFGNSVTIDSRTLDQVIDASVVFLHVQLTAAAPSGE